jgi:hypothetical protein
MNKRDVLQAKIRKPYTEITPKSHRFYYIYTRTASFLTSVPLTPLFTPERKKERNKNTRNTTWVLKKSKKE